MNGKSSAIWVSLSLYGDFMLFGIVGGGIFAASTVLPYVEARSWTKAQATIILATLEKGQVRRRQKCRIIYTYADKNGASFTGTRGTLCSTGYGPLERGLCQKVRKLQFSGRATCYYDPKRPKKSVLLRSFNHALFCAALLILALFGGGGLFGVAKGVERARRRFSISPWAIESEEQDWPIVPIMIGTYATLLAILTLSIAAITFEHGDSHALGTLVFGISYVGVAVYFIHRASRSTFAGVLMLRPKSKGPATLCIPAEWGGDIALKAHWVSRRGDGGVEPSDLRFVDVRENTGDMTEIDILHLPAMPEALSKDRMVQLKVHGKVGERKYIGTFDCGDAEEFHRAVKPRSTIVVLDNCSSCLSGSCDAHNSIEA